MATFEETIAGVILELTNRLELIQKLDGDDEDIEELRERVELINELKGQDTLSELHDRKDLLEWLEENDESLDTLSELEERKALLEWLQDNDPDSSVPIEELRERKQLLRENA
jgi:hypothetical protein